jgi:hypothetical protein
VLEYRPGQVLVVSDYRPGSGLVYFLKYLRGPTETLSRIPNTDLFNTYNEEVQLSADSSSIFMIRKPDTGLVVAKFTIADDSLPVAAARYLDVSFPTVPFNFGVSRTTGLLYLPNGLVLDSADLSTVGNTGVVGQVALSADGTLLYASHHVPGSGVDSLRIFDASTLQLRRSLPLPYGTRAIWASPLDPDILYVAGSHNLRAVRVGF